MNTNTKITAPISSNQVTEVGLLKPKCATFNGNSLNDWLKWLAEKECEIDWKSLDLTCLQDLLVEKDYCEQTQKKVIESIIKAICAVSTTQTTPSAPAGPSENIENISTENAWVATQQIRVYKRERQVMLSGIITSGNVNSTMFILPAEFRPAYTIKLPIITNNAFANNYEASLQITTGGVVSLSFKGTIPVINSSSSIFLDGITYFI